jgi:hypothetical protein
MSQDAPKKTEIAGVYKVSEGILINKDNEALRAYKSRKIRERKIEIIDNELMTLKNDISEIKNLLRGLIK